MKKVLIIEDDAVVGIGYQRFLQSNGFEADLANDGAKGLERLEAFGPDAVLLDLMMPRVSGIDVLRAIRAHEIFRNLPVIVLTNVCIPALVELVIQAGANHVFNKTKDSPSAILEALQTSFGAAEKRFAEIN